MVGWPFVVMAISLSIMALAAVIYVVAQVRYFRELQTFAAQLQRLMETLDRDARPALTSLRTAAEEGGRVATLVRAEVESLADTTRGLQARVEGAADRLSERFEEFESLADVLQDEIEDTVLDVAATLRATRRGSGLLRTLKRAFFKGR